MLTTPFTPTIPQLPTAMAPVQTNIAPITTPVSTVAPVAGGLEAGALTNPQPSFMDSVKGLFGFEAPKAANAVTGAEATQGGWDLNKTLNTVGQLGNVYASVKDQQMKEKQFESNEAFKEWMKQKEEERSKGAKALGSQLAR